MLPVAERLREEEYYHTQPLERNATTGNGALQERVIAKA